MNTAQRPDGVLLVLLGAWLIFTHDTSLGLSPELKSGTPTSQHESSEASSHRRALWEPRLTSVTIESHYPASDAGRSMLKAIKDKVVQPVVCLFKCTLEQLHDTLAAHNQLFSALLNGTSDCEQEVVIMDTGDSLSAARRLMNSWKSVCLHKRPDWGRVPPSESCSRGSSEGFCFSKPVARASGKIGGS
ncbi:hypothetical protein EYF80_051065 [Liparis tanakae]|uniref:Uncharacterized protein n=1 Tax=Liparis tanakae TaxID=230148 RepID=A0A4Z2FDB2_9TELE|nr:hypothetical protein EYF80_051065 [Liparis tanakae]